MYLTSLVNTGYDKSVDPAVRRRESLLASTVASSPSSDAPPSGSATPDSGSETTATTATKLDPSTTILPSSRSQEIAQAVKSGTAPASILTTLAQAGGTSNAHVVQSAAALSQGAGDKSNPIHVKVQGRECLVWILFECG
jgi:ATP-dependent metalloprotease